MGGAPHPEKLTPPRIQAGRGRFCTLLSAPLRESLGGGTVTASRRQTCVALDLDCRPRLGAPSHATSAAFYSIRQADLSRSGRHEGFIMEAFRYSERPFTKGAQQNKTWTDHETLPAGNAFARGADFLDRLLLWRLLLALWGGLVLLAIRMTGFKDTLRLTLHFSGDGLTRAAHGEHGDGT